MKKEETVVDFDTKENGQNKCPKCGATDISFSEKKGKLVCNFCRHKFELEKVEGMEGNISELVGDIVGSGAAQIDKNSDDIMTLKCTSCGAEVVIDTTKSAGARCHWCRNTLSINEQVPNGAVPDVVLPFKITKEKAEDKIKEFVGKRKFYANNVFKKEFTTENISGVYFPYFIVDVNASAKLHGEAEIQTRKYTIGSGDDEETVYDADCYEVGRRFDIEIDNLTVESSEDKLNKNNKDKTTNVINAIMPFDIENCVKWDANYIKEYSSEKRDTDTTSLDTIVNTQSLDIAKIRALETMSQYDRGISWRTQDIDIKGKKWIASYLPVWLYSYMEDKGNGNNVLHYVAVNARTSETMGSVPINKIKLIIVSIILAIMAFFIGVFIDLDWITYVLPFVAGGGYYFYIYSVYRNHDARHKHEEETQSIVKNMQESDVFKEKRKKLRESKIQGENSRELTSPH